MPNPRPVDRRAIRLYSLDVAHIYLLLASWLASPTTFPTCRRNPRRFPPQRFFAARREAPRGDLFGAGADVPSAATEPWRS